MATYEMFDHTADVGMRIEATCLAELFETAAVGLFDYVVTNRRDVESVSFISIELHSETTESLLVQWLNELVFLFETRHILFSTFQVHLDDTGRQLNAMISGEPIDRERHQLDHEVKAVTYHGLSLIQESDRIVAEIILDI